MNEILEGLTPEDFFKTLPTTTRKTALSMLASGIDPLDIAVVFATSPGEGLVTKGGELWPRDMLSRTLTEVKLFICQDSQEYKEAKEKLRTATTVATNVIVLVVADAVSIRLGMAGALCVPLVTAILGSVAQVGVRAWCKQHDTDLLPKQENPGLP